MSKSGLAKLTEPITQDELVRRREALLRVRSPLLALKNLLDDTLPFGRAYELTVAALHALDVEMAAIDDGFANVRESRLMYTRKCRYCRREIVMRRVEAERAFRAFEFDGQLHVCRVDTYGFRPRSE